MEGKELLLLTPREVYYTRRQKTRQQAPAAMHTNTKCKGNSPKTCRVVVFDVVLVAQAIRCCSLSLHHYKSFPLPLYGFSHCLHLSLRLLYSFFLFTPRSSFPSPKRRRLSSHVSQSPSAVVGEIVSNYSP